MKRYILCILLLLLFFPLMTHAEVTGTGSIFFASDEAMTNTTLDDGSITITPANNKAYIYVGVNVTSGIITQLNSYIFLTSGYSLVSKTVNSYTYSEIDFYGDWIGNFNPYYTNYFSARNYKGITSGKHLVAKIPLDVTDGTAAVTYTESDFYDDDEDG